MEPRGVGQDYGVGSTDRLCWTHRMYGIMPLEQYVGNYDSILENKPFQFGNMKGKILNKSRFFNDHSDYEVLLRTNVPGKYFKYFDTAGPVSGSSDIEVCRSHLGKSSVPSSSRLNLSPIKNHSDNGVKDSEVLLGKQPSSGSRNQSSYNRKENEYTLNLGDLNEVSHSPEPQPRDAYEYKSTARFRSENQNKSQPKTKNKIANKDKYENTNRNQPHEYGHGFDTSVSLDDVTELRRGNMDHIYDEAFKVLGNSSLVDDKGKQLNVLIRNLIENLQDLKRKNSSLASNNNDLNMIIKDLNSLIVSYKSKLNSYYTENKSLKAKLASASKLLHKQDSVIPKSSEPNSMNHRQDIDSMCDIEEIDKQITLLQKKKSDLMKRKKLVIPTDLSQLSDDIVNKLLAKLQSHNEDNHTESRNSQANINFDCPFCDVSKKEDLFSSLLSNSTNNQLSQEKMIDLLAERINLKLNKDNSSKAIPDIW